MTTPRMQLAPSIGPVKTESSLASVPPAEMNDRPVAVEELQVQLCKLQQCIYELIIRNQELRMALMEAKTTST
jgi:hypothetical protein